MSSPSQALSNELGAVWLRPRRRPRGAMAGGGPKSTFGALSGARAFRAARATPAAKPDGKGTERRLFSRGAGLSGRPPRPIPRSLTPAAGGAQGGRFGRKITPRHCTHALPGAHTGPHAAGPSRRAETRTSHRVAADLGPGESRAGAKSRQNCPFGTNSAPCRARIAPPGANIDRPPS